VALAFSVSAAGRGAAVDALYRRYLGRAADAGGRDFFVQTLNTGFPEAFIAAILAGTQEYFDR
jgi:hypothetical protein